MSVIVKIDIPVPAILRNRGLGADKKAQVFLADRVKEYCAPYVPKQAGMLRNTAEVAADGATLTYAQPYAHYHWLGKVMAGRAPKHYTGADIQNHVGGPEWDKRMLADRRADLEKSLAAYIGRAK